MLSYYEKTRAKGICTTCRKNPPAPKQRGGFYAICSDCIVKRDQYYQNNKEKYCKANRLRGRRMVAKKLCRRCMAPVKRGISPKKGKGYNHCPPCLDEMKVNAKKYRTPKK